MYKLLKEYKSDLIIRQEMLNSYTRIYKNWAVTQELDWNTQDQRNDMDLVKATYILVTWALKGSFQVFLKGFF